jgi:membrane-bound lytic murein transglycosylase D
LLFGLDFIDQSLTIDMMNKKNTILSLAIFFGSFTSLFAQDVNVTTATTETNNYDDEEIVIDKDNGDEEIIEVPEGMLLELDSLVQQYNAKTYLMADTSCHMRDVNPVYEIDVYKDRLKRLPTAMEMPWNDVVQKFIERYSTRLRRSVGYMLGASNFYMPIFEQALEVYGIPLELKYLPVIESALNPNAVSRVGATGLWQFMVATGKRYGLRVTTMIDERRDPVKSSYAAAHYLSDLYKIFGDWNLVIAAYNYGPENINKAIRRAGGVRDYWQIYPYLPNETRGYVPAFIAANYIMNYYCEHNICPMLTKLPVQTDTVMLYRDVHFEQLTNVIGISMEQLRSLNPQYRRDVVTGYSEPTDLRLPVEYINAFIEKEDSVYAYNVDQLMKRAEVAVNDDAPIYRAPSVDRRATRHSARAGRKAKARRARGGGGRNVTIKNGDTLSEIAKRNKTTVAKLKKLNNISGSSIRAGKKIRVR